MVQEEAVMEALSGIQATVEELNCLRWLSENDVFTFETICSLIRKAKKVTHETDKVFK